MRQSFLTIILGFTFIAATYAQEYKAEVKVQADKPGITVSPDLYGIFFEEINLAGDGGIYPELIRNRSFEFNTEKPEFWTFGARNGARGSMKLDKHDAGSEYNQTVVKIEGETNGGTLSAINGGYWGVPVEKGKIYDIVIRAKASDDFVGSSLSCRIESVDGNIIRGTATTEKLEKDWKTYKLKIQADSDDAKARFVVSPTGKKGTLWLDYISLKPVDTYKGNGLRKDLMEKLEALKPAFVRFPGGCWVEGDTMKEASRWKRTIGDPIDRWTQPNLWGYKSTNGLGYHEYLQMCEDLNASAMFVINCGMSHKDNIPMDKIDEYVQDALDAIEYANGPADSKWGKKRAEAGHPEPFNLKYFQIGNENGGPIYWERYDYFYTKIREKYPEMQLIACKWFGDITNKKPIEIYDEHYYDDPAFFIANANRYDSYERGDDKMKIYVGEYAVTKKCGLGNLDAAIGEAAFMTGMEKNGDVVILSSYAPLFVNANHRSWNPDMICFDGTRSYGIPSYHVQQMFGANRSDIIVPTSVKMSPSTAKIDGKVGVGTWGSQVEFKDAKVVMDGKTVFESKLDTAPESAVKGDGDWIYVDGVLRQTSGRDDCMYAFGDESWKDYTFSVKARKTGGREGFLLYFNTKENGQWSRANLGGWKNEWSAMQFAGADGAGHSDFTVETDRWYDLRIEVKGKQVKCFVDDKLILDVTHPDRKPNGVHIVSGLTEKKDELIMKVVNTEIGPCETSFSLGGIAKVNTTVKEIVLTSDNGLDENTFDYPDKVSPKESSFKLDSTTFKRTLPGKSVTVFRIGLK